MHNSVFADNIANLDYCRISFISKSLNRMEADLSAIRGERRGDTFGIFL